MFGALIDYWAYTGDTTYVDETYVAMQHQAGDDGDYMPTNQTLTEGNDDQGFWALSALTAAETNFENPTDGGVQWLAAAQAVFNEYVWRWEAANDTCGGGLRWQIFTFNNGYTYKNTISNGCFFSLAAGLARYTGNATYADWATTVYEWMSGVGFIDADYNIYDGASCAGTSNCTDIDKSQWTYNAGLFMYGSAIMYNYTNGSAVWEERTNGILQRSVEYFFNNSVVYEPPCEPQSTCTTDDYSFKGYMLRWMAKTTQMMASTYDTIYPLLLATAQAAAEQCDGTATASEGATLDGYACGFKWTDGAAWDGTSGVGQQMSALQAVFFTQVKDAPVPYSADSGGTSTGDASGGSDKTDTSVDGVKAITTADRVGAAFLTAFIISGLVGWCAFMVWE